MNLFSAIVNAVLFTILLSACNGSSDKDSPTNPQPAANISPIADAGADQTVSEAVVVTLQGVGTDSDGSIASFRWTEKSTSAVVIKNADSANASFEAPSTSERLLLTFVLEVTDNDGATATDEVQIIIDPMLVTHTIVSGQELVIELETAKLVIPADVLDAGVEVSVNIVEPETLAESSVGPGETLISPIYALTFSSTKRVSKDLLFSFNYPAELLLENLYARLKIEGGLSSEGVVDSSWSIVFDKIGSPTEQISVELSATATRILIVGINSGKTLEKSAKTANYSKEANKTATKEEVFVPLGEVYRPALDALGWIIACDPKTFENASSDACDPSHPDYNLMLTSLGEMLYKSGNTLTALGFPIAETAIVSGVGTTPHIIYDPEGRSSSTDVTFEKPGNDFLATRVYHLAWVSPDNGDTLGLYYPSDKRLIVNAFEGDDTAIHELMHAVQNYEIPNVWNVSNYEWITEGLADAVIPFSEADTSPSPEEYRTFGIWRDWSKELSSTDGNEEYQVSEFWLSTLDSNLYPLPDFYTNFASKGPFVDANGFTGVDQAMTASGLPALGDAYKALIFKRNSDSRYPYCESVTPVCVDASCEIPVDVSPISASCFDVNVSFETCDDVQDIAVTLESPSGADPNPNLEMLLDGTLYSADTEVDFSGQGRIWAINTDYSTANSTQNAVIKFKNKSNCYVKLLLQHILSSANADATKPFSFVSPDDDISNQLYHSVDDLSANSYIGNYYLGSPGQKAGWVYTTVDPIGLEPYESTHSAHAMSQFPEGAAIDQADADTYIFTDTDSDSTSMTTIGEQTAMASIIEEPVSAIGSNSSEYHYAIGSSPVELTLTWACTLSTVKITTEDPEGSLDTIFRTENQIQNDVYPWECGTKKWTIPPDNLLKIYITTIYQDDFYDANEHFKDTGGTFEINLDAVLPDK